jgi:hypothetical protein
MYARIYTAPFENLTFGGTADRSFFEIKAPADRCIILHGFSVTSDYVTDERARLRLSRYSTDGTGTAVAEVKTNSNNALTSESTVIHTVTPGTLGDTLKAWRWSQQGELLYLPTPEMREITDVGGRMALNLVAALGAGRSWSGWVCWEEI